MAPGFSIQFWGLLLRLLHRTFRSSKKASEGKAPKSVRERLTQHRANPACASCHSRIDGLGFALENYDPIGRWREEDSGTPVNTSGELQDGAKFIGTEELKAVLLQRKDLFIRNLTGKMLGYALGRGLTFSDSLHRRFHRGEIEGQ